MSKKYAVDDQRALLDELMGTQRDIPEDKKREIRFDDKDIDKFWLVGLQPFDMFRNTPWSPKLPELYRRAVGRHWTGKEKEQPRHVLEQWAAVPEEAKVKYGYEGELYAFLEELVKTNDRTVQKARTNHEAKASEITDDDAAKLKSIEDDIDSYTKQAEAAGENGDIDVSLTYMSKVEELQKRKTLLFKPTDIRVQKVLVCEISGNVVQNTPVRIQEHYQGRIYLSWKAVREKHSELQKKFESKPPPRPVPYYDYRHDPDLGPSSKPRSPHRTSRDEDRQRRHRDRSRSRERRRHDDRSERRRYDDRSSRSHRDRNRSSHHRSHHHRDRDSRDYYRR